MFIKIVEVDTQSMDRYILRETHINSSAILSITEQPPDEKLIKESASMGMSPHASYSKITFSTPYDGKSSMLVVGHPDTIRKKIGISREVLKG
tara:strand:- start:265 stop:543 length:279 start_codon:yes stop_codon:yes gene_type:complete